MKKIHRISALLAISLILGMAPIQAMEEKKNVGRLKKQFNESLDRFKRCTQGKGTRCDALKVVRDLGIAAIGAGAVIGATYVGKVVFTGNGSGLPTKINPDLSRDDNEIQRIFPLGSTIITLAERANHKGRVTGYAEKLYFKDSMTHKLPALEVTDQRGIKQIIFPTQARRLSLPKPE